LDRRRIDHDDHRKDRRRLHLQLHKGRLPLQSVQLQDLQLLITHSAASAPPGRRLF
jgi:hypothetical protein